MKTISDINEFLKSRRSIRKFKDTDIPEDTIDKILEAGRWAVSGRNSQPWRFVIVKDKKVKHELSRLTKYESFIETSNVSIAVFFNHAAGYDRDKDMMGMGACMQNMLLAVHFFGLGAVWIGQILAKKILTTH